MAKKKTTTKKTTKKTSSSGKKKTANMQVGATTANNLNKNKNKNKDKNKNNKSLVKQTSPLREGADKLGNTPSEKDKYSGDIHLGNRGWISDISHTNATTNRAAAIKKNYQKFGFTGFDDMREDVAHALRSNMMVYTDRLRWIDHFNRMQYPNPYFMVPSTREYLFFTKPDLHIMKNKTHLISALENDSFWNEMRYKYRRVISDLQFSARRDSKTVGHDHDKHVFIPMLTNAVSSELDLPAITADTTDTPATIYGTSIQYRKGSYKSDEGYDFSLDFIDSPWLDVYHFFKMWDEYETLKDIGVVGPRSTNSKFTGYYRINKILHDQISIYKIIVDGTDMETILYYAKLTGVFPKSVPRDSFSSPKEDSPFTYSVDFHAQFVEDMKPIILYEFDLLCKKFFSLSGTKEQDITNSVPIYSKGYQEINGGFRWHPYIFAVSDETRPTGVRYVLKWFDKPKKK